MIVFQKSGQEDADKIVAQVVEKSSGVFLWVVLACRSLSEGLLADDSVADLQQRVDELPPELQDLFKHILLKIEPRYRGQAAKYLRIMHKARSLPRTEPVQCLGLAFIEHHKMGFDRVLNIRRESLQEKLDGCQMIERRLRSHCWGLLEVKAVGPNHDGPCFCSGSRNRHNTMIDTRIEFMHRTVFEFLNTPEVLSNESLKVVDDTFDTAVALSWLSLYLSRVSLESDKRSQGGEYIKDTLLYAVDADCFAYDLLGPLMSNLGDLMSQSPSSCHGAPFFHCIHDYQSEGLVGYLAPTDLLLGVEAGAVPFVQGYCKHHDANLSGNQQSFPLLYHAVHRPFLESLWGWNMNISESMVEYLLGAECDPNETFLDSVRNQSTPWRVWLKKMKPGINLHTAVLNANITQLFLEAGADPFVVQTYHQSCGEEGLEQLISRQSFHPSISVLSIREQKSINEKGQHLLHLIYVHKMKLSDRTSNLSSEATVELPVRGVSRAQGTSM